MKEEEFDTIYASGGHGTITDFVDCAPLKAIIEKMYAGGKKAASLASALRAVNEVYRYTGNYRHIGVPVT